MSWLVISDVFWLASWCDVVLTGVFYHPVFQQFVKDMTTVEPSKELFIWVQQLMRMSTGIGTIELPLMKNLQAALSFILNREVQQIVVSSAISDDLVMEYKHGVGKGSCDPMVQASYSVLKYW